MYDFGKLGKWNKESLIKNCRSFMTFSGEDFDIEAIDALYQKLKKTINWRKKIFFMRINDVYDCMKNIQYNEELLKDFKKYKETLSVLAKEFLKDDEKAE